MLCSELSELNKIWFSLSGVVNLKNVLNEKEYNDEIKHCKDLLKKIENSANSTRLQSTQTQNKNLNIEVSLELNEIINKISDLLVQGTFSIDEKTYKYKIKTSVKIFVAELKNRKITDNDSKKIIYNNICLPKEQNNAFFEQVTWQTFRKYFY